MSTEKEPKIEDYQYVYAWHKDEIGRGATWDRLSVSDIHDYQYKQANNFQCFVTVQRFATKEEVKGEAFTAPLYFDLDYSSDPSISQKEAVKIIDFFMKELGVQESDIFIYFSGSKGFHILIYSQVFDIKPRNDLHKLYKHIAGFLAHRLGELEIDPNTQNEKVIALQSLDFQVYTARRMLRLPNSMHEKTRLFKTEVSLHDIKTKTLEEIKEMASEPRREGVFPGKTRTDQLSTRKKAVEWYADMLQEYEEAKATEDDRHQNTEYTFKKDSPPVCVQDILDGGWKKDGDRNQATVQLAAYLKESGHTKQETLQILEDWVLKHTSASGNYNKQQRKANTHSTVEAIYAGDYRFGCAFIRSLHGPKDPDDPNNYVRVACVGESNCACVKKKGINEDNPLTLHLSQTGNANLTGKLIKAQVMVAGKKHTPYIVPKRIEYHCWGRKGCKKVTCPLYNIASHTLFKDLGHSDRELIQMTGIGDDNIKGIIRELSGIPSCGKYDTNIVESTNVEELLVIPMAENNKADVDSPSEGKYVLRRIYSVGNTKINENKYYEITGFVFPHPKNQESTILIKEADPLQDVVDSFVLTDEIRKELDIFKPKDCSPDHIEEKLTALCNDLTYNVTHIVERDETLLGVLLVLHSVLRFRVPWDSDPIRGWLEMKAVGDTGTGKSALISKLLDYVGVGTRINAESTSRTGLTYKMEQSGTGGAWYIVWGAWPLADKEMIWIDEDTAIEKESYGEMTLARSDGRLEVKRAVTAETHCRVRAVMTGNVPKGKRLADYTQGVECLKDIFNNEDIRRFDFAIFMRAADVDPALYNKQLPSFPKMFSNTNLRNNILFAWSRKPEEVKFRQEALDAILEISTELSKVYGNANDIPLVSPSDQRNKVARLAVALASLTHSVDESGNRIEVCKGHVQFIGEYLKEIYNAPGCGLNYYARLAIKEEELTDERYEKLTRDLKELKTLSFENKFYEFIKLFAQQKYMRLGEVESMLSIEKDEAKAIVSLLSKMRMIVNTSGGFRKTPRFNAYISKCFEFGLFDGVSEDY